MKYNIHAVIFDFDYTLADSSKGIIECTNFALDMMGLPTVSAEMICQTIGLPIWDAFPKLVGQQHIARSNEFGLLFIKRADEIMVDLTILFESVRGTVEQLLKHGIFLGIVSTKFRYRIESVLKRESLMSSFKTIIGGEDVLKHKPDPEGLLMAIKRLNTLPSNSLYVGDNIIDAETAQQAGVLFVGVLSGKTQRDDFSGYDVYNIIDSLYELPDLIGIEY